MNLKDLKNIARAVFAAGILFSAGGCADEGFDAPDAPSDGMTIRFYSTNLKTRATEPSDASLNENLISNIAIALYPSDAADNIPAVKFKSFEGISGNGEWETKMTLSDAEVERLFGSVTATGATCRIFAVANISDQNIASLGNAPTIAEMKALPVTAQFETQQVQPDFVMAGEGTVQYNVDSNNNKTATGEVALDRTAAKITLNLKFGTRDDGNSVVDYGVVDAEGNTWKPLVGGAGNTGAMRVLLNNGVKNSEAVPGEDYVRSDDDYFNITTGAKYSYDFNNTGSATYPYSQEIPFYTYPNKWANTPQERRRTAMTLLIPWGRVDKNNTNQYDVYSTFYYTVPVTASDMPELISNNIYQVNLSVGMLGSLEPENPAALEATYQVVDWGNAPIDVDISETRYLVVSPTVYEVNNSDVASIQFYSSHPVEVKEISLTYNRYAFVSTTGTRADRGKVVSFTIDKAQIEKSNTETDKLCTWDISYSPTSKVYTITITHPLKVWEPYDSSGAVVSLSGYDDANASTIKGVKERIVSYKPASPAIDAYSPYTIDVTLCHTGKEDYVGSFTLIQNPGMFVEVSPNPGGEYNTGQNLNSFDLPSGGNTTGNHGYAFVNPTYNSGGSRDPLFGSTVYWDAWWVNDSGLGGLLEIDDSDNNGNPNMYIINVTTLEEGSDYIIGDPRVLYTNNSLSGDNTLADPTGNDNSAGSWSVDADALYREAGETGKRKLKHYYPTSESTQKENTIAPRFRIASSYAEMGGVSRENARRRCASYQEQGQPAGRWRMPTYGELKFIVWLGETGKIPRLFNKGGRYWTAQGAYTIQNDGSLSESTRTTAYVRAVYDEWYWEKEPNYVLQHNSNGGYDFTWGDMPKRNPQN